MNKLDPIPIGVPKINADVSIFNILDTVYYLAGAIAILIIVIAGFYYVVSVGSPETVKKAKNTIIGAVVGLIVIMMAFAITQFVIAGVKG